MQQAPAAQKPSGQALKLTTLWALVKQNLVSPGLDLVFPPVCIGCGRVDVLLCENCIAGIKPPDSTNHHQATTNLAAITALGTHTGILQKAIHALKYDRHTALAQPLGQLLAAQIRTLDWPTSVIMPIPLHPDRQQKRGYNQAALLAQAIAQQLQWRYDDMFLHRVRATTSQVGLDFQSRQANVKQAFSIPDPTSVQSSNVILVDDVYTTGATIRECAAALMAAGDFTVRAGVVGRAEFAQPNS